MKNKILFIAMSIIASMFSVRLHAQLKVNTDGNVDVTGKMAIGTTTDPYTSLNILHTSTTTTPYYGIRSQVNTHYTMPTSSICAIYGYANTIASTSNYPIQSVVGVYGKVFRHYALSNTFAAGVAGMTQSYGGIGVYGGVDYNMSLPTSFSGGTYAGYFNGSTKVIGTLTCTSLTQTSDAITKNNVQYLREDIVGKISQLKPISFYYNLDDRLFNSAEIESPAAKQMHYGFNAQELQEVLPNIVYMGQDSILSINYIELIPLLVKTIQNQETRIEELEKVVEAYTSKPSILKAPQQSGTEDIITKAVLYQNSPNPFTHDTQIAYELPLNTQTATLYIYDANGSQLESYPIREFGVNSINISGGHLSAGMYLYSLIADGQVIDTKRMILTK